MRYDNSGDRFPRMPLLVSALVFAAALVSLFAYTRRDTLVVAVIAGVCCVPVLRFAGA
jgi:predicted lysophospholipase L1 biosynthesis ABC-type transport system permease subunit